jgi:hypothetical protein
MPLMECDDGVRDDIRIGFFWPSGVRGAPIEAVSELRRRCMDMRFLFAAGVFELLAD